MSACRFEIEPVAGETGFHTGRQRYHVRCAVCDVVVHEATTGPVQRVNQHLRAVEEAKTPAGPTTWVDSPLRVALWAAITELADAPPASRMGHSMKVDRIVDLIREFTARQAVDTYQVGRMP